MGSALPLSLPYLPHALLPHPHPTFPSPQSHLRLPSNKGARVVGQACDSSFIKGSALASHGVSFGLWKWVGSLPTWPYLGLDLIWREVTITSSSLRKVQGPGRQGVQDSSWHGGDISQKKTFPSTERTCHVLVTVQEVGTQRSTQPTGLSSSHGNAREETGRVPRSI